MPHHHPLESCFQTSSEEEGIDYGELLGRHVNDESEVKTLWDLIQMREEVKEESKKKDRKKYPRAVVLKKLKKKYGANQRTESKQPLYPVPGSLPTSTETGRLSRRQYEENHAREKNSKSESKKNP
jgi:hypothetical protein